MYAKTFWKYRISETLKQDSEHKKLPLQQFHTIQYVCRYVDSQLIVQYTYIVKILMNKNSMGMMKY